jgi:hypothetical protein
MCFPSRHISPDIHFAILTNYYLCLITENYVRPLIYCPVQFPATKSISRWRLTWEIMMFLDTTLRLYPSRNSLLQTVLDETLQPVLWLNLAVTSFRVCRLFVFTLRKRILLSRGIVFRIPPLRGKFSMFHLSLIRFKNFWFFYCWYLSYFAFHSSNNLLLTNLELFLSARWLVPYRAVPLLLSRRLLVYPRGIIKLWTTAGRL